MPVDPELIEYLDRRFDEAAERVDQRFDHVDHKLEQFDGRFEQVDQRFEQVEERIRETNVLVEDLRVAVQIVAEGVIGNGEALRAFRTEMDRQRRGSRSARLTRPP